MGSAPVQPVTSSAPGIHTCNLFTAVKTYTLQLQPAHHPSLRRINANIIPLHIRTPPPTRIRPNIPPHTPIPQRHNHRLRRGQSRTECTPVREVRAKGNRHNIGRIIQRKCRGREREEYDHNAGEPVAGYGVEVPPVEDGAVDGRDFGAVETGCVGGELDEAGPGQGRGGDGGDEVLGCVVLGRLFAGVVGEDVGRC